jgi:hypothetical protein
VSSGADGAEIAGKTQTEGALAPEAAGAPATKAKDILSAQRMEIPSARQGVGVRRSLETWFISIPLIA